MPRNLVVTMNLGGTFLPTNVMESHVAAAARWGADYLQLMTLWGQTIKVTPDTVANKIWWSKQSLDTYPWPRDARVCLIDGDILLRDDMPSLFNVVPASHVAGVAGLQTQGSEENARRWLEKLLPVLGWPEDKMFDLAAYINGGLLIFDPLLHNAIWALTRSATYITREVGPMFEQTALNIAVQLVQVPLLLLPAKVARLDPAIWDHDEMESYGYHYANGPGITEAMRRHRMATTRWRGFAEQPEPAPSAELLEPEPCPST